jgi:isoleucyl-tRNA synthetase
VFKANDHVIKVLKARGALVHITALTHSYPHCWRHKTPIIFRATSQWFIAMNKLRDVAMKEIAKTAWIPSWGQARIEGMVQSRPDWCISRQRAWGVPIPLFTHKQTGKLHPDTAKLIEAVAGRVERKGIDAWFELDPQELLDGDATNYDKVGDTLDVWFDSGSMPVAQWHYPFENQEKFKKSFPADFISEGVDQTRGWFYSLLAIAAMLFDQPCYKTCISLELILDKFGQKMSKTKGNAIEPEAILNQQGADALRWYLLTVSPPWVPTRFDPDGVTEVLRKFLGTLVNVYSFFAIYANIDKFTYDKPATAVEDRPEIDRWLLSLLNKLVAKTDEYLSRYEITKAARSISDYVLDDLSNWYVRRCRRRFWKSEMGLDKQAAYETLYEVLYTLAKMMAPFMPFLSEEMYLNLTRGKTDELESVHLTYYPKSDSPQFSYRDVELEERMELVRRVVFIGRALRNESGIKVRQPLSRIIVVAKNENIKKRIERMANLVLDELNVKKIDFVSDPKQLTTKKAVPQFKQLGPRLGKDVNIAADIIRAFGDDEIGQLQRHGEILVNIQSREIPIKLEDVEIITRSAAGLVVQSDADLTVALDIQITEELQFEGLAREFVNRVQNMRKDAGFNVIDRIKIYYRTSDKLANAIKNQSNYICNETLAESLNSNSGKAAYNQEWDIDGEKAIIGIEKVS